MSNHDWGGGDWDEIWPPPPDEDEDPEGTYIAGDGSGDSDYTNVPIPSENLEPGSWEISLGMTEEVINLWDFITDPDNVDPANIRGIGFIDPEEAINWLYSIGLLGFSELIQIDDLWFPVIGDSDGIE